MMLGRNNHHGKQPPLRASTSDHVVDVGSRVSLRDLATGELDVYRLVLPIEADISRNCISTFTPLGKSIVGRKAGDVVEFLAPGGLMKIRIESAKKASVRRPDGQASVT